MVTGHFNILGCDEVPIIGNVHMVQCGSQQWVEDLTSHLCLKMVLKCCKKIWQNINFCIWIVCIQCSWYCTLKFEKVHNTKLTKRCCHHPNMESCEDSTKLKSVLFLIWHRVHPHISFYSCEAYFLYLYNVSSNIWKTCLMIKYSKERALLKWLFIPSLFLEQGNS